MELLEDKMREVLLAYWEMGDNGDELGRVRLEMRGL